MSRMQMLQKTANNSRNGEHTEKEENCNNTNPEPDYNIESRKKQEEKHGGRGILYSAGAFARMCQTTRDTLRYYEKQGILVPKKSEKNGYHYYSYAQISSYYFISTFRGLGCSVEDIKEYLLGGEEVRFDGFVDRQYACAFDAAKRAGAADRNYRKYKKTAGTDPEE